jgi:outer membrane protein TolC
MTSAGCASLDPTTDIGHASDLVQTRADTETGWSEPWDDRGDLWNGRSRLSADTAVRVALRNNREIRRQVEAIAATRADYVQAHLLPNPIVNATYGFTTDGLGGDPFRVALVQQLAWLWRHPVAVEAAEADLRRQILTVSDAALRLVAEVRQTHADVVYAERAAALQRENIELIERSSTLLHERLSVGEASRLDVNRVDLDLLRARTRLTDRTTALEAARRRLLTLLARADAPLAWRTDDVVPDAVTVADELDEATVMALASWQRLDVAAVQESLAGRVARLDLEDLGSLPDVSAGVGFEQNFSSREGVFPTVRVTPKLFDDNSAQIAKASSALKQAEIEADRVLQAAIGEAREAWVTLRGHVDVVTSYDRSIVTLADQNYRLAALAFDAGETDLTVLLEAQRQLNDARLELTDRRRAATDRLIELQRITGGSLDTQPPTHLEIAP